MATETTSTVSTLPPPSGTGAGRRSLVVVFLAATTALLYVLPGQDIWIGCALAAVAGGLAAIERRPAVVYAAAAWLLVYLAALAFGRDPWPVPALVALAGCGVAMAVRRPIWRSLRTDWLRAGHFTPAIWLLVALTVGVSAVALVSWAGLAHPDTSPVRDLFGALPLPALLSLGVAFAAINAAAEEVLFRGFLMGALDSVVDRAWLVVAIQAVAFGVSHANGFPDGVAGMVLAGIYGAMLGIIRRRSRGLLPSWVAHVVADSVIFGLMVGLL
jgi:CAAX protease family protein